MATPEENRVFYGAQVEALALAAIVAKKLGDADVAKDISDQLTELVLDMDVPSNLQDTARAIRDELGFAMTDAGLARMQEKVAQLHGASTELQQAITISKTGQKGLFFPKVAGQAQQALTDLSNLKTSLGKVQTDLRQASDAEIGNLPKQLQALMGSVKKLRDSKPA